jgi:hypothetical protein
MDLSRFISFWYDVIPTIAATVAVIATIVWDRTRAK